MAEPLEELEPLFDYTRVQPRDCIFLDDDEDDSAPVAPPKRRKASNSAVPEGEKIIDIADGNDEGEENDDWLKSPPKVVVDKKKLPENSIIKELRQKKQELMSLTESANDIFQSVEEALKKDLKTSMDSASETPKPSKPAVERPKIVISIQDKDGLKQFRVYTDDKFERLFRMYADRVNTKVEKLVFSFDGDKVNPLATPGSLDMEDDDLIEVHVKSS